MIREAAAGVAASRAEVIEEAAGQLTAPAARGTGAG